MIYILDDERPKYIRYTGSVLVNESTPPTPIISICTRSNQFTFGIIQGQVKSRHFLGQALRQGQARGAQRCGQDRQGGRYIPSIRFLDPGGRALRPQVKFSKETFCKIMYKFDEGGPGGGPKIVLQEKTNKLTLGTYFPPLASL